MHGAVTRRVQICFVMGLLVQNVGILAKIVKTLLRKILPINAHGNYYQSIHQENRMNMQLLLGACLL